MTIIYVYGVRDKRPLLGVLWRFRYRRSFGLAADPQHNNQHIPTFRVSWDPKRALKITPLEPGASKSIYKLEKAVKRDQGLLGATKACTLRA